MKKMLKAFPYYKNMDCGMVVASSREEAIRMLVESRPMHDEDSVDYTYGDTYKDSGVYPVPYEVYGGSEWEDEFYVFP